MSLTKKIHEEVKSAKQKSNKMQSQSQKNLNVRLDNLYFKNLTGSAYDAGIGSHNSNCLYFVQRDSSTIEVYKGETKISGKGKLSFLHLALLTGVWWDVYLGVKMPITIPESPSVLEGAELYYGSTTNSRYLYRHQLAIRGTSQHPLTYQDLHTEIYTRRASGNVYVYKDLEVLPNRMVRFSIYRNGTKIMTVAKGSPGVTSETWTKCEVGFVIVSGFDDPFESYTDTYFYQTGHLGIGYIYTHSDGTIYHTCGHWDESDGRGIFWNAPPNDSELAQLWTSRDRLKEFYDNYEGYFSQCVAERYDIEEDTE